MLAKHGRAGIQIQAMADVVTVEHEAVEPVGVKHVVKHVGHGALSTAAQSGEPHHASLVAVARFALRAGNVVFVPMDLNMFVVGHFVAGSFLRNGNWQGRILNR
jgi:hypothetical protein